LNVEIRGKKEKKKSSTLRGLGRRGTKKKREKKKFGKPYPSRKKQITWEESGKKKTAGQYE